MVGELSDLIEKFREKRVKILRLEARADDFYYHMGEFRWSVRECEVLKMLEHAVKMAISATRIRDLLSILSRVGVITPPERREVSEAVDSELYDVLSDGAKRFEERCLAEK